MINIVFFAQVREVLGVDGIEIAIEQIGSHVHSCHLRSDAIFCAVLEVYEIQLRSQVDLTLLRTIDTPERANTFQHDICFPLSNDWFILCGQQGQLHVYKTEKGAKT